MKENQRAKAIRIRDARGEDQEQIKQHLLEAYTQYEQLLSVERWTRYKQEIEESAQGRQTIAFLVADWGDEIVGSVQLFASAQSAYNRPELEIHTPIIRFLAVSPKARGNRIAERLIEEVVRRSRDLGAATLHLHTTDMMAAAVKLYERLGFARAVEKDFFNGETHVKSYWLRLGEARVG
ncbi:MULTISPECIES: GNAT family N-acetyltransferase [Brevibacillus]|jgi:Acetyltransferases|uniref:GNAT family N-acetyltransferase n=1 Tax=Brevibacillus TaxID=55080 RepID=UPI00156ADD1D|nr:MULTISPECIES: GNAT family N-acetyltransferase [Brevibacillus]MDH6350241.1 ribosomal protein S18 acetylase RimI-like enzyme [Brevibacillus sp. 1238]MDR4999679.1 GNAT family N-acetyltransferase [Brevibacillus parabrevis]UED66742.1 GNAT family N-acetyltransferase [Brevibacillus sp. HD3.3A]WDV92987.1 GNAT family N-acetyltransferase [Brevibacillus parabrevis]